jgi:hypothetical protein
MTSSTWRALPALEIHLAQQRRVERAAPRLLPPDGELGQITARGAYGRRRPALVKQRFTQPPLPEHRASQSGILGCLASLSWRRLDITADGDGGIAGGVIERRSHTPRLTAHSAGARQGAGGGLVHAPGGVVR